MSLIPIMKKAISIRGSARALYAGSGKRLWVLERGDPARTIDPDNVEATETVIPLYSDPAGTHEVTQPVTSDSAGRWPYWMDAGQVDLYCPDDPINPIEPWDAQSASSGSLDNDPDMATSTAVGATKSAIRAFVTQRTNKPEGTYDPTLSIYGSGGAKTDGSEDAQPAFMDAYQDAVDHGGGVILVPAGHFWFSTKAYVVGGFGAHLAHTDDNITWQGMGRGITKLDNTGASGPAALIHILGYCQDSKDYATRIGDRFYNAPFYSITGKYAKGDRVLTFANAGDEANFQVGDPVFVATGQVDVTTVAGRDKQPDACYGEVTAVDTSAHTITLKRGLPKPMQQEYYADGTSSVVTTLTSSAYPAKFGVYNMRGRALRKPTVRDMTMICAATNGPGGVRYHAWIDMELSRLEFISAAGGGLALHGGQEGTLARLQDIDCEVHPGVATQYWGMACGSSHVRIDRHRHVDTGDVATCFMNEGVADFKLRDCEQWSHRDAATGLPVWGIGQRTYDFDLIDSMMVNASPAAAFQITETEPRQFYTGNGRIVRPKAIGNIPNIGYIRGNWQVIGSEGKIALYGPPNSATAVSGVPQQNSPRGVRADSGVIVGRLPHDQVNARLYIGRLPTNCYMKPPLLDVNTAFSSGTKINIGTTDSRELTLTNDTTLPAGTIDVGSTANLLSAGALLIGPNGETRVTYTGKSGSTVTGVTGGSGTWPAGTRVVEDFQSVLGFAVLVDTTGIQMLSSINDGYQSFPVDQDVYIEFQGGSNPAAGELVVVIEWVQIPRQA